MVKHTLVTLLVGSFGLVACSLAPDYKVPEVPLAAKYQSIGPWVTAQPADELKSDGWWQIYNEPRLDELEQRLIAQNPDLSAALSHYAQAIAYVAQVRSALYPQVYGVGDAQRNRQSDTRPLRGAGQPDDYNAVTLGAEVDYDLDLWGRVRDSVAAGRDEAQATQADLASVQLSLEIQLADSYIQLRGLDQQKALLVDTVAAYEKALELTQALHNGGLVSDLDVERAQTQLSSARSQLSQTTAERKLMEHAIAALVGASASEFGLATQLNPITLPVFPTGVPSTLLQRRPDIAAAERRVAEANAKIGVARAAYFPTVTLSAQGGLQSDDYAKILSAPSLFWAIGPTLATYIFDGGRRRAQVDAARAATDEAAARYRSVVLMSFRQVEDNLALLSDLGEALQQQRDASRAAQHSVDLALQRYRRGAVSYLDVVDAQTAALDTQRGVLDLQTRQLSANVQLVHALGGGWSRDRLAEGSTAHDQIVSQ
jgi:NodT family efflux transporter outer membrane factor (OMF) lipoprotein